MSFWIVETSKQLNKLSFNKDCYINIIPLNNNFHPLLTSISLIYYRNKEDDKGFIFPINHNDGFELKLNLIKEFLLKHPKIYCLNKKELVYYLGEDFLNKEVIDINLLHMENNLIKLEIPDYKQTVARFLEKSFKSHTKLNSFIPITKHFEEQEFIYYYIQDYLEKQPKINWYQNDYIKAIYSIEKQGIGLNIDIFNENFIILYPKFNIKNDKIWTNYNLYNFTGRPTNSFNGVNFAALKKTDNTRESFICQNDYLFEYDYASFHLYIIAGLINYTFEEDAHIQLGKLYFNKEELDEEDYKQSKSISFQQMYGSVRKQYESLEFFKNTKQYIQELWEQTNKLGYLELKGGRQIKLKEISEPTPSKLFNYLIQSLETYYIIDSVNKLLPYLENKKSSLILSTYDSILIDYHRDDGKEFLKEIKKIIESNGFKIKVSYGTNYSNLNKIK
jgi:hypothetical protein